MLVIKILKLNMSLIEMNIIFEFKINFKLIILNLFILILKIKNKKFNLFIIKLVFFININNKLK